jgi:hypothetical protein
MKRQAPEPLPPPCGFCAHQDGAWRIATGGGLKRCGCARGVRLAAVDATRKADTRRAGSKVRAFPVVRDGKMLASGDRA